MTKAILGTKVGMTQVFGDNGEAIPVTVVQAGPCVVVQKKTAAADGYDAIQVAYGEIKPQNVNKPLKGHFTKAGVKPLRHLKEFRIEDPGQYQIGQELKADLFQTGDHVDVTATSRGKGFAGGIKRHGFHRGPMKHGSKYHRRPGSLGAKGPARVFKGRKLPGHAGSRTVTVQNLEVVRVDPELNLILVKGAIPGPGKALVTVWESVKAK